MKYERMITMDENSKNEMIEDVFVLKSIEWFE